MKCPVCGGEYDEGALFCTECGANLADFANVSPDKIINNQTPEQQKLLGDDERTVLLPENGMQPKQAITPQAFVPQGMNRPQPGYQQQNMYYQNNMQGMVVAPVVQVNTGMMKLFSAFAAISAAITAVLIILFMTNPVYYIFEHYIGDHPEFREAWKSGDLMDSTSKAEFISTSGTYCVAAVLLLVACVVLGVIGIVKTTDKINKRPASMFSIMTMLSGVMGSGIMLFFKFFFGLGFKIGIKESSDGEDVERMIDKYQVFNCYDWITVLIVVTVLIVIVNLVVAMLTEKKWAKANKPQIGR